MMGSSPVANQVCWGSIIAIPLNLTIPSAGSGMMLTVKLTLNGQALPLMGR